jgi:hypothetical protein
VRQALARTKVAVSEDVLLSSKGSWDWNYPDHSWRTEVFFKKDKTGITVSVTTYDCQTQDRIPVVQWNSTKSIQLSGTENSVTFEVTRQWTQEAARIYPQVQNEVGKQFPGAMTISADVALRCVWKSTESNAEPWDLLMNQRGL